MTFDDQTNASSYQLVKGGHSLSNKPGVPRSRPLKGAPKVGRDASVRAGIDEASADIIDQ
ncbi:hypothetical protein [Amycolatopsis sp. NPDC051716]|uniref:hypothetical protein n=1 Tax=Amycolatopsis sp. NPDC051716 TaxID=3155804 RepID=UPI00342DB8E9